MRWIGCIAVLAGVAGGSMASQATSRTPTRAAPVMMQAPDAVPAPDFQPLDHARAATLRSCLPAIAETSRLTLDAPHVALSTWSRTDPDQRLFNSVAGLRYDNAAAPRGVSVVTASPNPAHTCDATTVQVQPSALSCAAIRQNLGPLEAADLSGIAALTTAAGLRLLLLPTAANGCTVVGVGVYFGK